jgi:uncharacterized membrane protein YczE
MIAAAILVGLGVGFFLCKKLKTRSIRILVADFKSSEYWSVNLLRMGVELMFFLYGFRLCFIIVGLYHHMGISEIMM